MGYEQTVPALRERHTATGAAGCVRCASDGEVWPCDVAALLAILDGVYLECRVALRAACDDLGDNDWPDNLHPADVIEKHLHRTALARASGAEQREREGG